MAFMASKVRWHLLSIAKLLISLLLASATVATRLGDEKQQLDSKSVWNSTTQNSTAAEMKASIIQISDTPSETKHLDEMTITHLQIEETNNDSTAEEQLNLNSTSREMINLARLTDIISAATQPNNKPTVLPNMMTGTDPKKKSHIIFSAYTELPTPKNSTVIYTKTNATDGNPVDAASGVYTAKTPGFYGFIFHALTKDSKNVLPTVELRVNGVTTATAAAFNGGTFKSLTLIAGAKLKRGDHVSIFVVDDQLFDGKKGSKHRASFAGTLMI